MHTYIIIHFRHQIFDEYGKVVFSKEVNDNPGDKVLNRYKNIDSLYDAIVDGRLYKCRDGGSM